MSKVFDCPECGWVPEHYPNCPLVTRLMELLKEKKYV